MNRVKDKRLWLSIVGITGLGLLSGLFSVNAREYYQALRLPSFAPPGWLFGPVWLVLYIFMGITFYFILVHPNKQQKKRMITLFILQFIANFFWTFFFFSLQNNLLSVIDISLLWLLLIVQQWDYLRYKLITRGWLMIPYILWVTFAAKIKLQYFIFKLGISKHQRKMGTSHFFLVFILFIST